MAKASNRPNLIVLLLVVAVVAIGAYAWTRKHRQPAEVAPAPAANSPFAADEAITVASDKIDPANEGRVVAVAGNIEIRTPARDTQLGISANTVMLLRFAEMLQWAEQCAGANCTYQQVWSVQLINSSKFRVQQGHKNPDRLPITSAHFSASDVRVGAFLVNAAVLGNNRMESGLKITPVFYPVTSSQLPSNLAISFRDANGVLYAGDPEHRAIGDVRVSYRIVPAEKVEIIGVQRGERLIVKKSKPIPS